MTQLEVSLRDYAADLRNKNKIEWFPILLYDMLQENLPQGLIIKLGEIILKNKGAGK